MIKNHAHILLIILVERSCIINYYFLTLIQLEKNIKMKSHLKKLSESHIAAMILSDNIKSFHDIYFIFIKKLLSFLIM